METHCPRELSQRPAHSKDVVQVCPSAAAATQVLEL